MFSHITDASKVALVHLVHQLQQWGYELIDCQAHTNHLQSLGAINIPREQYLHLLNHLCAAPGHTGEWCFENVIKGEN